MYADVCHAQENENEMKGIHLYHSGFEHCEKRHSFGPAVRDHFLIHCIFSGKGIFQTKNQQYPLKAGQGFLIHPGIITTYTADSDDPWFYGWVGFGGTDAAAAVKMCGLNLECPIFSFQNIEAMQASIQDIFACSPTMQNPFPVAAKLFEFFDRLCRENGPCNPAERGIVEEAVSCIARNYSYGITVDRIAQYVGIDRSHLFRIFKKSLGISPQDYLLNFKLNRARQLLKNTSLQVMEIMYSCGFSDPSNFSRQFKKAFGVSPAAFRKINPPET